MIWARMLAYITGTVDQELLLRNEYLAAENRILRAQIKGRLLRRALRDYEVHYHKERNHQGKDNLLLFSLPTRAVSREEGAVRCRERLGGLLKYYEREAA